MPRPNSIWFRKDTGWWMVTLAGEKVRLAKGRASRKHALQKFHELMAVRPEAPESVTARVADVIEAFLAANRGRLSAETMRKYDWYGQAFAEHSGFVLARELKPHHVTAFVNEKGWGATTEYNARRSLFRMFSWACEEGLLSANPLRGMKRPKPAPRGRGQSEAEFRTMLRGEKSGRFKRLLFALWSTGCRPKEARTLRWENVLEDRWVLPDHKTVHKTRTPRVVYLNAAMRKLMKVVRRDAPGDHVFTNTYGEPWTGNAIRLRVQRLKKTLGLKSDVCAYLIRHAFGTNAIVNGVDVATVAELMGHRDLEMVSSVYLHLASQPGHLAQAVERATTRHVAPKTPPNDAGRAA
jgi:integrase